MCKVLKVNRASYYHWISSGSVIKRVDTKLNELVESIFTEGKNTYGTRRIQDRLLLYFGLIVSRKRISNIMKDLNLKVKMKRRYKYKIIKNIFQKKDILFSRKILIKKKYKVPIKGLCLEF